MPPRDPSKTQLDNPALVADLIDQLRVLGTIGLLDFRPEVIPTFIVGSRGLSVETRPTVFPSAGFFQDNVNSPAASTVLTTTGALPAGTFDVGGYISVNGSGTIATFFALEHRNAADTATLAILLSTIVTAGAIARDVMLPTIGIEIAVGERLRWLSPTVAFSGQVLASIRVAIRPVP